METLLVAGGALFLFMSSLFIVSLIRRDNGTADIGYSIAFLVVIGTTFFLTENSTSRFLVLLPLMWALRLSIRIYRKNRGKSEDFRYRAWREAWGRTFVVRSFFQIYILQGLVVFTVALPITLALIYPSLNSGFLAILGAGVWGIGFIFEALGDAQLDRFIRNPENKGKIMMSGLWKYSRHPNYFGESMMWFGIAIAASGLSVYPLIGFLSPLLISLLLLKVSGVPLLEKRWEGNPEWEAYKTRTSVFIPLPQRN